MFLFFFLLQNQIKTSFFSLDKFNYICLFQFDFFCLFDGDNSGFKYIYVLFFLVGHLGLIEFNLVLFKCAKPRAYLFIYLFKQKQIQIHTSKIMRIKIRLVGLDALAA